MTLIRTNPNERFVANCRCASDLGYVSREMVQSTLRGRVPRRNGLDVIVAAQAQL